MLSPITGPNLHNQPLHIRLARIDDVPAIVSLVAYHARRGMLLPRSTRAVRDSIEDWLVAEADGHLLGCVSLLPYASGLVEVRSLAVHQHVQGLGIGQKLLRNLILEAKRRRIPTLFALTRAESFFERFGFTVSDTSMFPEKVWYDCRQCPLLNHCDETAMVLHLWEN